MSQRAKRIFAGIASSAALRPFFGRLLRDRAVIYMLHRFREQHGHHHDDPRLLRACLALLRRHRVPILSLREAFRRLAAHEPLEGVIFTVDDGYFDCGTLAAPVFREFDVPATVFVATGFVDGHYWFWWDKLTLALNQTATTALRLGEGGKSYPLTSLQQRSHANVCTVEWIRSLPQEQRAAALEHVLRQLGITVPERPVPAYRPLTWDEIRSLSKQGIEFAPHTVNHPSVASMSASSVREEVQGSVRRLAEEGIDYVPVFAYPYGQQADLSPEAAQVVKDEGLSGAVTALPGYVTSGNDPFFVPRFSFPQDLVDVRQVVFGFERFKEVIHAWRAS